MNKTNLTIHFILNLLTDDDDLILWLDMVIYDDEIYVNNEEHHTQHGLFIDDLTNLIYTKLTINNAMLLGSMPFLEEVSRKFEKEGAINIDTMWDRFKYKKEFFVDVKHCE